MASDITYATAIRDKVYVYRMDYAKDKWQSINLEAPKDKVQFIGKGDGEHYLRIVVNGKKEDHLIAKDANIDCTDAFVQVPLAGSKELYGVKFKLNDDAMTFHARIKDHVKPNTQPYQTSRETTPSTSGELLPAPFLTLPVQNAGKRQPQVPSVRPVAPPQEMFGGNRQQGFGSHQDMQRQPPGTMQNQPMSHAPQRNQMQMQNQPMSYSPQQNQMGMPMGNQPTSPPVNQQNNLNAPGIQPAGQMQQRQHGVAQGYQSPGFEPAAAGYHGAQGSRFAPAQAVPQMPNAAFQQGGFQREFQQQRLPMSQFPGQGSVRQINPQAQLSPPVDLGPAEMPAPAPPLMPTPRNPLDTVPPQARQPPPVPRKPVEVQPKDLPMMATLLMNAINTGDKNTAAELVDTIMSAKAKRQFNISCDENKECPEETQFSLNVRIEFQQTKKQPLDIFLDVVESHNIFYLQHIMEHQYYIPKASQNWIIGPRLVKENEMNKSLRDFEITHKAGTPKVFMYVVHAKKANVPRDDYEVIRKRQAQAGNQQPVQMQPLPQENAYMGQQPSQYPQQNQQQFPQANAQAWGPARSQNAGGGNLPSPYQQPPANQGQMLYNERAQTPQENVYGRLGNRGFLSGGYPQQQPPPPHQAPMHYDGSGQPLYGRLGEGDALRSGPGGGGGSSSSSSSGGGASIFQVQGGLAVFPSSPNTPQIDGVQPERPIPAPRADPPPKAKPKPKPKPGWDCPACTFHNNPHRPGCEMCGSPRPADYKVPEDVPLDEEAERIRKQEEESEKLFLQYEEKEQQRKRKEAEENYKQIIAADEAKIVANLEEFECMICADNVEPGNGVILKGCLHQFCKRCLHDHVMYSEDAEIKCPHQDANFACGAIISEREIREVVDDEELQKVYQRGLQLAENADANSFHCRHTDCKGFCFVEDEVNAFVCPICKHTNCLLCKAIHEEMDCQEYQDDLKRRAANDAAAKATQDMLEDLVRNGEAMKCPKCDIVVQKRDGCDWIRCSMCRTEICWATKGPRWGPNGHGDTTGGCKCRVGGKKCHPLCRNCH